MACHDFLMFQNGLPVCDILILSVFLGLLWPRPFITVHLLYKYYVIYAMVWKRLGNTVLYSI